MREVFKIQNITGSDIHLRDFGLIIPPNQIVELASFDRAVLSDELNDLLNNGNLVRLINDQPVTLTEIYMSTIQVQGVDSSLIAGQINDLHNYDVIQDVSITTLIDKNITQDASIITLINKNISQDASITDLKIWNSSQDVSLSLRPLTTYVDGSLNLKVNKGGDTMTGSLIISGADLIVGNDTLITRNLNVGNNVTIDNNLTINNDASINQNLNVKNNTFIGKDLNVSNNALINNNLNVGNDAFIIKNLSIHDQTYLKGILITQPDDLTFGTPDPNPLPSIDEIYNSVSKFGTGGPNVNNITEFVFNWGLSHNQIYTFSFTISVSPYWINLLYITTHSLNQAAPELTISGSNYPGLDGSYWATSIGNDLILVSKTGTFSLYFSNASVDYIPPQYKENYLLMDPITKKIVDSNLPYILFGREFNRAEAPDQQTTTQRSYQTALSYTLPNVPKGRYRIGVNFRHNLSSKKDNFYGRITIDNVQMGTPLTARQEIANQLYHSRIIYEVLEGSPTIAVQYYGSSGTAYISDIVLEIWRVE